MDIAFCIKLHKKECKHPKPEVQAITIDTVQLPSVIFINFIF